MKAVSTPLLAYVCCMVTLALASMASAATITVITPDRTVELTNAQVADGDLWVVPDELTKINDFQLKSEGACCGAICIPVSRDPSVGYLREIDGHKYFNLSKLARTLEQPLVAEADRGAFSFGEIPAVRAAALQSAEAPNFTLPDRTGKLVQLSEFRGKKVLLLTWASWCGCKLDLAGWQGVYADLKDKNFEIVAAAEDTGGEAVAGPWYDKAKATYTTLIDRDHVVSSLYHMVNVPTGVWINEQGHVVRPSEVAYSRDVALMSIKVNGSDYVTGLRDWVEKGTASKYVVQPSQLTESLGARSTNEALADAHFKLATYFKEHDDAGLAEKHWKQAQTLNPDCWNYHRQDWAYTSNANGNWLTKVRGLGSKPYYAPLKLPTSESAENK
jgi:peroxiredoxin